MHNFSITKDFYHCFFTLLWLISYKSQKKRSPIPHTVKGASVYEIIKETVVLGMRHGTMKLMKRDLIKALSDADNLQLFGGKAAHLSKMLQASLPVPQGFAVSLNAFENNGNISKDAVQEIKRLLKKEIMYAVRSSAIAEDAEGASWAGQFETFLNTSANDVIEKIKACHNSTKTRAKSYAADKKHNEGFAVAVIVQEMITPEYAGVLFTKDPVSGEDRFVTEYIEGLGEALVSGQSDPKRITWKLGETTEAPFNLTRLTELTQKVEQLFDKPQDIEWAWADNRIWLLQARPITAIQKERKGFYLGNPDALFYWGPSRAQPMYMSDFITAVDSFFSQLANNPTLPNPPKTLILFWENKMVWLNSAKSFGDFVKEMFASYRKQNCLEEDRDRWYKLAQTLATLQGCAFAKALVQTWKYTLFAEFSLYGAESAIAQQLRRFDPKIRQEIWGSFTVPDTMTFLARIDKELKETKDPRAIAKKYPWIQDGYEGHSGNVEAYLEKRLLLLQEDSKTYEYSKDREALANRFDLTEKEVQMLTLARELAEFMDERKAWMMQTRTLIKEQIGSVTYGWFFENGKSQILEKEDAKELWERYVNFKASNQAVKGIVASNGGRHFINGEVAVAMSPTEAVGRDKILVVPATSPSYVPLMRNAKALITDHGGMMSHAAIVAREFGLPCIVGTKQATKVLKTGDLVVLDLVKGEINK